MGRVGHVGDVLCTTHEVKILYRGLDDDILELRALPQDKILDSRRMPKDTETGVQVRGAEVEVRRHDSLTASRDGSVQADRKDVLPAPSLPSLRGLMIFPVFRSRHTRHTVTEL